MNEHVVQLELLPDWLEKKTTQASRDDEEDDEDVPAVSDLPLGDPRDIRIQDYRLSVESLARRMASGTIDLQPDFQRQGGLWSEIAMSRLIESMMLRIPIPSLYVDSSASEHDEFWVVVDGLQRLTAVKKFVVDKTLRLQNLEYLNNLNGMTFDELPWSFRNRIELTQLTISCIERGTPEQVKFNVFRRINTGGLPLSAQEIRNALYGGAGLKLLKELAQTPLFEHLVGKGGPKDRMTGHEYVLRFLALCQGGPSGAHKGSLDFFLNDRLKQLNRTKPEELERLRRRFHRALGGAFDVLGENAFRKVYQEGSHKLPVNKALFEAWMVNLDELPDPDLHTLTDRKDKVLRSFILLMQDSQFEKSISMATRDLSKVKLRVEAIRLLIQGVLRANTHET